VALASDSPRRASLALATFGPPVPTVRPSPPLGESGGPPKKAPPKKLRILLVVEPGLDGVFRHVEGLVGYLLKQDVSIHIAYSSRRCGAAMLQLVDRVRAAGGEAVDLRVTNNPELRDAAALLRLVLLMRRIRPDIVHMHSSK